METKWNSSRQEVEGAKTTLFWGKLMGALKVEGPETSLYRILAWLIGVCCILTLLGGCASGGIAPGHSDETLQRQVEVYRLGTGDRLRLNVFGEDNLSGEFVVGGAGTVSLPLIGDITATGKSPTELKTDIEAALADGYLKSPRVNIELLNYRPFFVLGEVSNSGEYPYAEDMTVLNAVATAGGFTYRANKKTVFIKRAGAAAEERFALTATTPVQPGDTIRIGERLF